MTSPDPRVWTFGDPNNPPEPVDGTTQVTTTRRGYTLGQVPGVPHQWRPTRSPGNDKPWDEWLSDWWGPLTEVV